MKSLTTLDVLVVQSANLAASASVTDAHSKHPFLLNSKQAHYNQSYEYFLEKCQQSGIKAGLTTSADIIGPGTCSNYWTASLGNWKKVDNRAKSLQIFDKFLPVSPLRASERQLMLSDEAIMPFHDAKLFDIFCDKLLTYQKFPQYAIPTVSIKTSKIADIKLALKRLKALIEKPRFAGDFSAKVVLKDRYGASGNFVYKISEDFVTNIRNLMLKNKKVSFILQPFVFFDKGFTYKKNTTATDLRLIFHHDKLLQCYIRMAKANDFRCNEQQGGRLEYVTKNDIPILIRKISHRLVVKINKPHSLYALDFVVSNSGNVYFIEGNIGPGIDWDKTKKIDEMMSKQLIGSIVDEFAVRIDQAE
jgi:hypothetical protein